ncbi:MAG TPA: cytochrome b/b6 domain-containing protein [Acetobacteraceae bacterium]|nr:cytochrome b/b6 domain-containing protein [Acetobacteraceae bacterium]
MTTKLAVEATRVAASDGRVRYDSFAMALHWTTAALVVLLFLLAELWGFAPRAIRREMIVAHMSFGVALTLVLVVRIGWRVTPGHRVQDATTGMVEMAAKTVHHLLYALLIAQVILGFVFRWSGNEALSFFGLQIPPPFAPFSKPAHRLVGDLHAWNAWIIIILAAGHAGAALFHHYILRDDVLGRMLPGIRARRADIQAADSHAAPRQAERRS